MKQLFTTIILASLCALGFAQEDSLPQVSMLEIPKNPAYIALQAQGDRVVFASRTTFGGTLRYSVFDTWSKQELWKEKLGSETALFFTSNDRLYINVMDHECTCIDLVAGAKAWTMETKKRMPLWFDGEHLLVRSTSKPQLFAIDPLTKLPNWVSPVEVKSGLNYIQHEGDNLIVAGAENLYKINIQSGQCFSTETKTQVTSGKRVMGNIGLGVLMAGAVVLGAGATGYVYIPVPVGTSYRHPHDGILGDIPMSSSSLCRVCSQVLSAQGRHFYADRNSLRCFDEQLQEVWTKPFPKHRASNSFLYQAGDTLVVMNNGSGFLAGNALREMGRPFVAAYHMEDGSEIFYKELADGHRSFDQDFQLPGAIITRSENMILKISLADSTVSEIPWNKESMGNILEMADYNVFRRDSAEFVNLGRDLECVVTKEGEAFRLSESDAPVKISNKGYIYRLWNVMENGNLCLYGGPQGHDCWIASPEGKPLYHFEQLGAFVGLSGRTVMQRAKDKVWVVKL